MHVFAHSAAILIVAFVAHLVAWRVHLPERQTQAIIRIFCCTLALGAGGSLIAGLGWGAGWALTLPQALHVCLVVLAMVMAYIITYSALEADSPTIVMMMILKDAGQAGIKEDAFHGALSDEVLVLPRIRDLIRDAMATLTPEGRYALTPKGQLMVRVVCGYRSLLGVKKGG